MKITKMDLTNAKKLHAIELKVCKERCVKYWGADLAAEIMNLDWSPESLKQLAKRNKANRVQTSVLIDLHRASKMVFLSFAVSEITK